MGDVKNPLPAREKVGHAAKSPAAKVSETQAKEKSCVICGNPATRLVDGEPSCDEHVELVYEDQLERYTQKHIDEGGF
jgi:hypothetical protein